VPRALAILASINRAIVACPTCHIPNIEFSFCPSDIASWNFEQDWKRGLWTLTRQEEEHDKWLIPDFGYWSWPLDVVGEYTQVRVEMAQVERDLQFVEKKPLLVWRGAMSQFRENLLNVTHDKSWSDVREIQWLDITRMAPESEESSLTMAEHCQYQFVINTEGS
jgi:hypothetical protein